MLLLWFEAESCRGQWARGVGLERVRPAIKDCSVDWDSGDKRRRWSGNVMEEKPTGIDSRLEVGEVSSWDPMFLIQALPVFKMSGERVVGVQVEGGCLCESQKVEVFIENLFSMKWS